VVTEPGLYKVIVEDSRNHCQSVECVAEVIDGRVYPVVKVTGNEIPCDEECSTLVATSITPGVSYRWTRPNGTTSTGAELEVCEAGGPYTVRVTHIASGCHTDMSVHVTRLVCPPCKLRTQTQGGWGTSASGNNPGVYRDANFAAAFPAGLTIGCGGRTLKLTSAAAVQAFLPSGTNARVLNPGHLVDPGQSYRNVFAGQLVAAKLSVGFDAHDPNFGAATGLLGNAVVVSGPFAGMTVSQIIAIADQVIGGCSNAYSPQHLNNVLDAINNNYVDGTQDHGFLLCTNGTTAAARSIMISDMAIGSVDLFPNPVSDLLTVRIGHESAGRVLVDVMDMAGRSVIAQAAYEASEGEERLHMVPVQMLDQGAYLLIVRQNDKQETLRFVISR
jgi:hypothetical protein